MLSLNYQPNLISRKLFRYTELKKQLEETTTIVEDLKTKLNGILGKDSIPFIRHRHLL